MSKASRRPQREAIKAQRRKKNSNPKPYASTSSPKDVVPGARRRCPMPARPM
jgi:hypothetical protein